VNQIFEPKDLNVFISSNCLNPTITRHHMHGLYYC